MANKTSWVKGKSANPGGRPKEYFRNKDYARNKSEWAFKRLEEIARQNENLGSAYQETMGMLAYGIGKPVERIDLTNSDGSMSQAWLAAMKAVDNEAPQEQHVEH